MTMQNDNNFEDDRLAITADTATKIDLLDIEGPEVSHECVPEKYKDLIPEGFKIQLVHQVQDYSGHNVFKSKDGKNMTVYDPLTQKNYSPGDNLDELWKSIFEGILPPCALNRRRRKRSYVPLVRRPSYCVDENGRILGEDQRCTTRAARPAEECLVCMASNTAWDCTDTSRKCVYVLKCSVIDNQRRCIDHQASASITCQPCCLMRGCPGDEIKDDKGGFVMGTCRHMPLDDICPLEGTGCPRMNVQISYTGNMVEKECHIDRTCKSVFDSSSTIQHSGVNCAKFAELSYEKKFCCNNPDPSLRHNLGNC